MAEVIRRVHQTTAHDGDAVHTTREVEEPRAEVAYHQNVVARVVWYITGVILVFLAIRFVFALLAANPANGLASFIYSVTHPLVSPFFNLFSYNYSNGVRRFESFTLVAMVIYGLVGYGLGKLFTLNRRTSD
jgi:uncharacterized protein YggT (Ycf19 family)